MTEINPATDDDIVRIEQDIDIGWTINPRSVLSLIARIRAEREWQPIETAPHACTFLATYWSDDFGEWTVGLVMRPLDGPWTHWRPLPTPPAFSKRSQS